MEKNIQTTFYSHTKYQTTMVTVQNNQRILGTNKFLYKIKVKDNVFCTFCQEDEKTIEHLFLEL